MSSSNLLVWEQPCIPNMKTQNQGLVHLAMSCGALEVKLSSRVVAEYLEAECLSMHCIYKPEPWKLFRRGSSLELFPVESLANLLNTCRKTKDNANTFRVHVQLCSCGLDSQTSLGNHLVSTLVELGFLQYAQKVFDNLSLGNQWSFNSLIIGYVQIKQPRNAIELYNKLGQNEQSKLGEHCFVAIIKACSQLRDVETGIQVHGILQSTSLFKHNVYISSALIDMYAKCNLQDKAQMVFDDMHIRDVISWTALIGGYVENRCPESAINCFEMMQADGVIPSPVTFICCISACGNGRFFSKGLEIHAELQRKDLVKNDINVANALVDMHFKCGSLSMAREVFDCIRVRDVISWTTLIGGCIESGSPEEAIQCFKEMQADGISPNNITFASLLKACCEIGDVSESHEIHAEIEKRGLFLKNDIGLGNALESIYAKLGFLLEAEYVFQKLAMHNQMSWSTLISGYSEQGLGEKAIEVYKNMQLRGVDPDTVTFMSVLKACTTATAIDIGEEVHVEIERRCILVKNISVCNSLIDMYIKLGLVSRAEQVFETIYQRNVVTWNVLISGYVEHGQNEKALECAGKMRFEGMSPDAATYIALLKACGNTRAIQKGEEIHKEIDREYLINKDIMLVNSLIHMYIRCGELAIAQKTFDEVLHKNVISWNILIEGYTEHGYNKQALKCFDLMQLDGVSPDSVTFLCSLKACGNAKAIGKGQSIHQHIEKLGLLKQNIDIGNALVNMYANCRSCSKAQEVFDHLPARDIVSWNTLLAVHTEYGECEEAFKCFEQMQHEGVQPDAITYSCILKVCGKTGTECKGQEIHANIERQGLLETNVIVGGSLVEMYTNLGFLSKAKEVFYKVPVQGIELWTSLMTACAQSGKTEDVFQIFDIIAIEGIKPDSVTFTTLLNTCSRSGLSDKSQFYFEAMVKEYGVSPTLEHHSCMVDSLSRAGNLGTAVDLIKKMPHYSNSIVWQSLLDSCTKLGNLKIGMEAFDHVMHGSMK